MQLQNKTFTMLSNPLLIWRKLTHPDGNRYGLCTKPKKERKLGKQAIPTGCKGSGKNNLEANVVWPHCCRDTT